MNPFLRQGPCRGARGPVRQGAAAGWIPLFIAYLCLTEHVVVNLSQEAALLLLFSVGSSSMVAEQEKEMKKKQQQIEEEQAKAGISFFDVTSGKRWSAH